jgi:hypothetical protein
MPTGNRQAGIHHQLGISSGLEGGLKDASQDGRESVLDPLVDPDWIVPKLGEGLIQEDFTRIQIQGIESEPMLIHEFAEDSVRNNPNLVPGAL